MILKKAVAKLLLIMMVFQMILSFGIFPINVVQAIDSDGTANLDMTVSSTVEPESIIGQNFSVNINLGNASSSESDAFSPGFIVQLPPDVVFVSSSGLGAPVRTETLADGSTLLFFKTDGFIPKGSSDDFALNLSSNTSADLFTPTDIEVLAYAEDNIYGVGAAPSGSPAGTLDGGYDYAGSSTDPVDPTFPDNIDASTDLSTLPFFPTTTEFIPFNIEKLGPGEFLIGEVVPTTLRITGNNLGPLNDFQIIDVIPNNRKFVGFTNTAGATTTVDYDTPSAGQVTLTISNIDVPTGGVVDIEYETLGLAYEAASYSGTTVLLNTGALINDQTVSTNIATQQPTGTWDDGSGTVNVTPTSVIEPREHDAILSFGELEKSVSKPFPVIGDTIRYTITYDLAQNMSYDSNNGGTQIEDLLPDGLSFTSLVSSINSGGGDALSLTTNSTSADGDTTLIWSLGAGDIIEAGDFLTIVYDVLVDGLYEGAGDQQFENTQSITNNAQFSGNIADSGNNAEWGYTDPSLIGNENTDTASAEITAPSPTNGKQLVRVEFPDGNIYDAGNPLPAGTSIPVGSRLDFNIYMDFPNVYSTGARLVDALPLVSGPNNAAYNIAFQTNAALQDLTGASVPINDDNDDGSADTSFNGQTLGGTTPADTAWITPTPANNLEFDIAGGSNAKTFSIGFSVDILPIAPSGGAQASLPIKNVLVGSFSNDIGTINSLDIISEPFVLGFPIIEMTKDINPDPTTDIAFGDTVTYNVTIQNTGDAGGYLENIVDTLPANMNLDSFTMLYGSGSTPVPGASVVQSGATLEISFDVDPTLNRSYIGIDDVSTTAIDESTIILTYDLSPTVDFVIVGGETRENTIALDYYSTKDATSNDLNKIDTIEDMAEFTVASPTITRTYFSTSESDSPTNGGGGRPDIHAGEESIFETTITLPPGTYTNSRFTESLLTSRLNFVSGDVISTGPDLSFSTGTGFTSNLVNFGDIVNSGTGPQTIVIHTTARGRNDTTRRNNNRARGDFRYSGETITRDTPVDLIIPTLNITKSVNPTEVDTDDIFTYTIEIEHTTTSNARAYDVLLKDILPSNVTYVPGTLAGNGNFTGTEADLFSGSGIILPDLADGDTETLTFDANIGPGATATTNETNTASIDYSTLDDDGSAVEANFSATGSADVIVKSIEVTHYISSTNNGDTGSGQFTGSYDDLTIGEEVVYTIEVDVPALLFSGVTLTQTLPDGIEFSTGFVLTDGVTSHTIDTFTINPDGTVTFDFGDIDNTGTGSGDGFVLQTTAVVTDVPGNSAGDTINSSVLVEYDGDSTTTNNTPNFDIVEPGLTITKVYAPDTGDGGDSIPTTITITNPGTAPLYDISWTDTLPPKSTGATGYLASSSTGVLLPGESITYTYNAILDNTVVYGEMLTGTASVMGDSMPGTETEERDYSATASDIITIIGIDGLQKDLTSSGSATIGDVESYILRVPVPEGVTDNITINDLIPTGMEIIPGSIVITSSGGLSYSGTVTPTIGTTSIGNTQTNDYVFDNIVNSDTDNAVTEYITITYDAVVLNTSDNNAGDTKAEDVTVNYNSGTSTLTDGPVPVDIVEPNVGIDLTSTYTYGNDVTYTYTLTNSGASTAYDLSIDTILPTGLTYTGAITITNSGGVVGIIQAGEDFTIEELPVNTGSPLQFTIAGIIDGTVADMTDLTVDADLTYTGQDDTYTSVVTNSDNTERTGTNTGENDYLDTDPDTITVLLPILNEDISVVDLNGGVGIIGDVFEYTITLSNSGSVDLTDISALLDIPSSFTGFTIIAIPSGPTDNSTSTGGTNGAGQVDISDIDLLIGQSVTIVYQVTALDTVPSGITVNSEVTVSDTPEGALGGTPDVDVTILAPSIQLSKTITATDFSDPTIPNDTITYELIATNTGDVALYNVVVSDPMLGGDITSSCSFPGTGATLNPTESATCNPADYSLTTSDIIRGYVQNSAEVMSEDESMNPVNDISDAGIGNEASETTSGTGATDGDSTNDPTVQALSQEPELTVTKIITGTGFNLPNLVGDTITYQITVENTGNLNVSGITITDPLLGGDITSTCSFPTSAAVGLDIDEVATCNPPNYEIDVNDIIRGYVDNNATAIGTDALDETVRDVSDPGNEITETPSGDGTTTDGDATNDPTTIEIIGEPELRVTKVISATSLSNPAASGDTITYQITILNSGQLPVSNITLNDTLLGGDITTSCDFPISASDGLEVGQSAICNPLPYSIDETDIVRDYVDNNATANGIDPNNDPVSDISDPGDESTETLAGDNNTVDGDPTNDPTVQVLVPTPRWEIRKETTSTPERVGDILKYTFELENTGNITINTPTLVDEKCSVGPNFIETSDEGNDGRISPNEIWNYTCTSIPVTQIEVNEGSVDNTVIAEATTVFGDLPTASGSRSTALIASPGWKIQKSTLSAPEFTGDTLDYTFILTNTGNVSISNINVTDAKCDAAGIVRDDITDINSDNILDQDEFWNYRCMSIPVTQEEVNEESIVNSVSATGTPTRGVLPVARDEIDTFIGNLPRIQLYKTATFNDEDGDGKAKEQETITYNFTVRNTGNVDLTNVLLADSLIDMSGLRIETLPVGAIDSTTFIGVYELRRADLIRDYVENTAIVTARDLNNLEVIDISDAGDDTVETESGVGSIDNNPTNDPTVIKYERFIGGGVGSGGGSSSQSGNTNNVISINPGITSSGDKDDSISRDDNIEFPDAAQIPASIPSASSDDNFVENQKDEQEKEDEPNIVTNSVLYEGLLETIQKQVNKFKSKQQLLDVYIEQSKISGESLLKSLPDILPKTGTPIVQRIETIQSQFIDTDLPSNDTFKLAGSTNMDLNYWKQVLPEQDKNSSKYIVIPSNGLVVPINEFSEDSAEFDNMINGREGNINPSLETGALEYPGTSTRGYGETGNKVIFGHSSYFKNSPGRYKTHFQKIIELDIGEQIWIYEKQANGEYDRFVYVTDKSYNTPDDNTSILKPGVGKNLTLFTCTPIGGIKGRWVIQAKYIDETISNLEREVYFKDISVSIKTKILKFLDGVGRLTQKQQGEALLNIYARIEDVTLQQPDNQRVLRIIEYFQLQIGQRLLDLFE